MDRPVSLSKEQQGFPRVLPSCFHDVRHLPGCLPPLRHTDVCTYILCTYRYRQTDRQTHLLTYSHGYGHTMGLYEDVLYGMYTAVCASKPFSYCTPHACTLPIKRRPLAVVVVLGTGWRPQQGKSARSIHQLSWSCLYNVLPSKLACVPSPWIGKEERRVVSTSLQTLSGTLGRTPDINFRCLRIRPSHAINVGEGSHNHHLRRQSLSLYYSMYIHTVHLSHNGKAVVGHKATVLCCSATTQGGDRGCGQIPM
jgi:hypothetical protein